MQLPARCIPQQHKLTSGIGGWSAAFSSLKPMLNLREIGAEKCTRHALHIDPTESSLATARRHIDPHVSCKFHPAVVSRLTRGGDERPMTITAGWPQPHAKPMGAFFTRHALVIDRTGSSLDTARRRAYFYWLTAGHFAPQSLPLCPAVDHSVPRSGFCPFVGMARA